jgi:2-methylcitrate dehydratase PrpD
MRNGSHAGKTGNWGEDMSKAFLENIAQFVTQTRYEQLDQDLVELAKKAITDTVGVAVAGWNDPPVQIVKNLYGAPQSSGIPATLWGDGSRVPVEYAALINGTASHALDYDDVLSEITAHPSAPVLAALIPMAEALPVTGKDLICAYHIGVEVMLRIGKCMGFKHYELGWHATSTLGTLGATAACAHVAGLSKEQTAHAIAIACSLSGGLQKNFGSMTKPLHVGMAGMHGVQAVRLAQEGFTASSQVFGSRGFLHAFSGFDPDQLEEIRFGQPFGLTETGLTIKKFPCCFATHKIIQAALELSETYHLQLDDVDHVKIVAPTKGLVPLIYSRPVNGLQGKFSAEYTVLAAIADGKVSLKSFDDDQVQRAAIQKLLSQVHVNKVDDVEKENVDAFPVTVEINTQNQQTYEHAIVDAPGSKHNPMSRDDLKVKWDDCWQYRFKGSNEPTNQVITDLFVEAFNMEHNINFSDWIVKLQSVYE